ncbi:MAG: hypothetical protein K2X87_30505 [Gemmataceae bacterium]|nr:hypothetical protein [Gemmataceae bacterium]
MTPPLPPGFDHRVEGDADVIAWSNRRVPKDRALVAVLVVVLPFWTACTLALTGVVLRLLTTDGGIPEGILVGVLPLLPFSAAEMLIVWGAPSVFGREEVRIGDDRLELWRSGRRRDTIHRDRFRALTFECYDGESVPTLNLLPKRDPSRLFGWQRRIIAGWVRPVVKADLFDVLQAVFERHGWELEYRKGAEHGWRVSGHE